MTQEQHTNARLILLYYFRCIRPHTKPTLSAKSLSEKSNAHYTLVRLPRPNRTALTINITHSGVLGGICTGGEGGKDKVLYSVEIGTPDSALN
jgi:hypothetical protein